ncbi:hypothetical protein TYRP_016239 [Tyrophagus putrescentiae]|nr:hypothetical protein TYRP_016239 [Tyrophagus putrescentiae]
MSPRGARLVRAANRHASTASATYNIPKTGAQRNLPQPLREQTASSTLSSIPVSPTEGLTATADALKELEVDRLVSEPFGEEYHQLLCADVWGKEEELTEVSSSGSSSSSQDSMLEQWLQGGADTAAEPEAVQPSAAHDPLITMQIPLSVACAFHAYLGHFIADYEKGASAADADAQ